jgi:hypothetical protein
MAISLWMTEEIQSDVAEEYADARREIEAAMNAVFSSFSYGDALEEWVVIGTVRKNASASDGYGEINRYVKKERSFESRLKIPHAEFKAANAVEKRMLIVGILLRSIAEMRRRKIPGIDFAKLESDVRELAAAKGWV